MFLHRSPPMFILAGNYAHSNRSQSSLPKSSTSHKLHVHVHVRDRTHARSKRQITSSDDFRRSPATGQGTSRGSAVAPMPRCREFRNASGVCPVAFFLLLLPSNASAGVIARVSGPNQSEVSHASCGGNVHVYVTGTNIGTPFAPPQIRVGIHGDAECRVQGFTSSKTRLHCIIGPDALPPPRPVYTASAIEQQLPLYLVGSNGAHADCWHVGGINHGCFLTFDLGGTPRLARVLTPVLHPGSLLRVAGNGVDGGLTGAAKVAARLVRAAGELAVGCVSRYEDESPQAVQAAVAHSDERTFGCRLEQPSSGGVGTSSLAGFFNVSLAVLERQRGDAYTRLSTSQQADVANGVSFEAEL